MLSDVSKKTDTLSIPENAATISMEEMMYVDGGLQTYTFNNINDWYFRLSAAECQTALNGYDALGYLSIAIAVAVGFGTAGIAIGVIELVLDMINAAGPRATLYAGTMNKGCYFRKYPSGGYSQGPVY